MFETAAIANPAKRIWSTCAGVTAQTLLVLAACLAPIVRPDVLPRAQALVSLVAPGPPLRSEPAAASRRMEHLVAARPFQLTGEPLRAPSRVPIHAEPIVDLPIDVPGAMIGRGDSGLSGLPGSLVSEVLTLHPITPPHPRENPAPAPAPGGTPVIRLHGGDVRLAHPVYRVEPQYPRLAIAMRISGAVELEGIIATDGRIRNLRALSGNPLLVPAALDAVRRWIYEPTLLNGKPVEVIAPITVLFRLTE